VGRPRGLSRTQSHGLATRQTNRKRFEILLGQRPLTRVAAGLRSAFSRDPRRNRPSSESATFSSKSLTYSAIEVILCTRGEFSPERVCCALCSRTDRFSAFFSAFFDVLRRLFSIREIGPTRPRGRCFPLVAAVWGGASRRSGGAMCGDALRCGKRLRVLRNCQSDAPREADGARHSHGYLHHVTWDRRSRRFRAACTDAV